jgi:cytochrome c-type biogenesis protein CcmH
MVTVIFLALATGPALAAQPAAVEEEARRIETMLIAPCCFSQQVSEHQSEASLQVRQDIRARLGAGQTREQILDAYVNQYGKRILAEPEMKGFGALAIAIPAVLLALTGLGLAVVVRRFARERPAGPRPALETVPPALVERLDTELRDLD